MGTAPSRFSVFPESREPKVLAGGEREEESLATHRAVTLRILTLDGGCNRERTRERDEQRGANATRGAPPGSPDPLPEGSACLWRRCQCGSCVVTCAPRTCVVFTSSPLSQGANDGKRPRGSVKSPPPISVNAGDAGNEGTPSFF